MRRHLLLLVAVVCAVATMATAWAAADPARPKQWNLDRIGADAAIGVADGTGVIVAVVDSGVDLRHEDLAGRLVPGYDFVDDDDVPQDANGHGTHVAGIIAATRGNGIGIAGVAPGAKVMPVRVLDADGAGTLADVVDGIRFAVRRGARVINLSLGEDKQAILGPAFADAIDEAWRAGAIPVVSAGNQFITGSGFTDEPAVVVAATDRDDGKPTYSSGVGRARWGIAAPGGEIPDLGAENAILSTYWSGRSTNEYAYVAGTSQAAPHVSGALALLLSTGRFSPEQAVRRILDTARDIGMPGPDATFGAGRLDVAAALAGVTPAGGRGRPASVAPATTTTTAARRTTTTAAPSLAAPAPPPPTVPTPTSPTAPGDGADTGGGPPTWRQEVAHEPLAAPGRPGDGGDPATGGPAAAAAVLAAATGAAALGTWRHERSLPR